MFIAGAGVPRRARSPAAVRRGSSAPAGAETPSWYPAVGECVEIPLTSTVGQVIRAAGGNSYPGTDPDDIMVPWSGGAIVLVDSLPYLVCYGGGHGDSGYNGLIKVGPLWGAGSDSPTASIFLAASAVGAVQNSNTYTDGRQSSVHSYNNLVGYNDRLYSMRTDGYHSVGSSGPQGYYFTPSGQTSIANSPTVGQSGATAVHEGKIYHIGGNTSFDYLRIYDIAGNSWTTESNGDVAFGNYVAMAIDTTRDKVLVVGGASGGSTTGAYWDIATQARQTGIARPGGSQTLEFDPDRDAFVAYQGTLTIKEADAAALAAGSGATWVDRTFTGDTPSTATSNGVFGRFRHYAPAKGYFVIPSLEASLYFFRSA